MISTLDRLFREFACWGAHIAKHTHEHDAEPNSTIVTHENLGTIILVSFFSLKKYANRKIREKFYAKKHRSRAAVAFRLHGISVGFGVSLIKSSLLRVKELLFYKETLRFIVVPYTKPSFFFSLASSAKEFWSFKEIPNIARKHRCITATNADESNFYSLPFLFRLIVNCCLHFEWVKERRQNKNWSVWTMVQHLSEKIGEKKSWNIRLLPKLLFILSFFSLSRNKST